MINSPKPQQLSLAAQHHNAILDGSPAAYLQNAARKMDSVQQAVAEAQAAVDQAHRHSDPAQRPQLGRVGQQLDLAASANQAASRGLIDAVPNYNATLAKDGKSQFNAAVRGDPRLLSTLGQQNKKAEARDNIADMTKTSELPSPGVGSQQVANSRPHPYPHPSPELAGGVDSSLHHQAMQQDDNRAASAREARETIASDLRSQFDQTSGVSQSMDRDQGPSL